MSALASIVREAVANLPPKMSRDGKRKVYDLACKLCGKKYQWESTLANHEKNCVGPEEPLNRNCDSCGAKCPSEARACWRHSLRSPEFRIVDEVIRLNYGDRKWKTIPWGIVELAAKRVGFSDRQAEKIARAFTMRKEL